MNKFKEFGILALLILAFAVLTTIGVFAFLIMFNIVVVVAIVVAICWIIYYLYKKLTNRFRKRKTSYEKRF